MKNAVATKQRKTYPASRSRTSVEPIRDAERTQQAILAAAKVEFAEKGLAGARVDTIAEQSGANKRMLYYYFGSKEDLYIAVLEDVYGAMRQTERELNLTHLEPMRSVAEVDRVQVRLLSRIRRSFDFSPARIMHEREVSEALASGCATCTCRSSNVLADSACGGTKKGIMIRAGIDPLQLYISIASLSYFYFSIRRRSQRPLVGILMSRAELKVRRAHAVEVILSYVRPSAESCFVNSSSFLEVR